ncbi:MAG: response regulator [Pseudomonadota bacterium]
MARCLIIEDSAAIRAIAARLVTELGLEAVEASSAEEAMAFYKEITPDVVMLDWDLPSVGAVDFLKAVAPLREDGKPAIILCATENDPQQFALARAAGANEVLLKPFDKFSVAQLFIELGLSAPAPAKPRRRRKKVASAGGGDS